MLLLLIIVARSGVVCSLDVHTAKQIFTPSLSPCSASLEAERTLLEEKYETNISNLQKNMKRYYSQELDVSHVTFTNRTNECTKHICTVHCVINNSQSTLRVRVGVRKWFNVDYRCTALLLFYLLDVIVVYMYNNVLRLSMSLLDGPN